jgi:hypothetical protein
VGFRSLAQITGIHAAVGYRVIIIVYYMAVLRWTTTNPGGGPARAMAQTLPQTLLKLQSVYGLTKPECDAKPRPESPFPAYRPARAEPCSAAGLCSFYPIEGIPELSAKNAALGPGIDCVVLN